MTFILLDNHEAATTGATISFLLFLLLCYGMVGLLSYRLKIVMMTDDKIKIVFPFRFQSRDFKFTEIKKINWDLWGIYRLGDYRKLTITTNSGTQMNISDLEFINFDSFEKLILERTRLDLNLDRKLTIELQQAKGNRWINLFVICVFVFFFILLSSGHIDNNSTIGIRIGMIFITWRLLVRLIHYQKRIHENKNRRKLRKKNQPPTTGL